MGIYGGVPQMVVFQNVGFIEENPIKMYDFGYFHLYNPLFNNFKQH